MQVPASPFVTTKLGGLSVLCPNHNGSAAPAAAAVAAVAVAAAAGTVAGGCGKSMFFGKEGMRLRAHLAECTHAMVPCPDCKAPMLRHELLKHKPSASDPCPAVPIQCELCKCTVQRAEWDAHQRDASHVTHVNRSMSDLTAQMRVMSTEIAAVRTESSAAKDEVAQVKRQLTVTQRECDEKVASAEARYEQRMAELRAHSIAYFCEFEVPKWCVRARERRRANCRTPCGLCCAGRR
jgi:hypothetical protein